MNMCVPYVWASQVALVVKNLPASKRLTCVICELYTFIMLLLKKSLNLSVLRDEMHRQSQLNASDPHCGVMCRRSSSFSRFMFTFCFSWSPLKCSVTKCGQWLPD